MTFVKLQFDLYRKMIRRSTGLISFDVDFFRAVVCILLLAVSYYTTVGICQYPISFYMKSRRYEHMVDTTFGKTIWVETIEGSVCSIAEIAFFV